MAQADGPPRPAGQRLQHAVDPRHRARPTPLVTHVEIGVYPHGRALLPTPQASQEVGGVAFVGVRDYAAVAHSLPPSLIQQGQGNLGLGLKRDLSRYTGLLPK